MYQKIMVPLDGSALAECVLPHVESVAKGCGAKAVVFVSVVEPFSLYRAVSETDDGYAAKRALELRDHVEAHNLEMSKKYLDGLKKKVDLGSTTVQTEILQGNPEQTLIAYAEKQGVDLIVMATHGRSGVSKWVWGSVADRLLRGACVPVLMVRAPGCVEGI